MKYIFLIIFISPILLSDNNIKEVVKSQYESQYVSGNFDIYVDRVVEQYKEPEESDNDTWYDMTWNEVKHYVETLAANYGYDTQDIADNMMENVFKLYAKDLNQFISDLIKDDLLISEIKANYNDYIAKSSNVVFSELDYGFQQKFLNLYNSDSLQMLLKEDIKEKIIQTKNNIIKNIRDNVMDGQWTMTGVAAMMIASNRIMEIVKKPVGDRVLSTLGKRFGSGILKKVGGRLVPYAGLALLGHELYTVNELYESIGNDIKEEFHNNEDIIINNIADTLADIDNISSKYQASISTITADYILKAKVPYSFLSENLKEAVLKSENYIFLEILERFYQVPEEFYSYIVAKYMSLPDDQKHQFAEYVANLDDKFALENVMVIENELKLKISLENYSDAVEFFDRFEDKEDIYKFFAFMPSVQKSTINLSKVKNFYYPYEVLKSDAYLLNRYAQLKPEDREKMLEAVEAGKTNFERIAHFEEKNSLTVPSDEFVAMAELLSQFDSNANMDKFYDFAVQVMNGTSVDVEAFSKRMHHYVVLSDNLYLQGKYIQFSSEERAKLITKVEAKKNMFEDIQAYETHYSVEIPEKDFIAVAETLSQFKNLEEIKHFHTFVEKVSPDVMTEALLSLHQPYEVLKSDAYLLNRYVQLKPADREKLIEAIESGKTNFERIAHFEEKNNVMVPLGEFMAMAQLLSQFNSNGELDSFIVRYNHDYKDKKVDLSHFKKEIEGYFEKDSTQTFIIIFSILIFLLIFFYVIFKTIIDISKSSTNKIITFISKKEK